MIESGNIIRVSQDSSKDYGGGLVFCEVEVMWPEYQEHEIRRLSVQDMHIESRKRYIGMHTYNRGGDLEVIDLKYYCYSLKEYMARKRVRKVFMNKYGG